VQLREVTANAVGLKVGQCELADRTGTGAGDVRILPQSKMTGYTRPPKKLPRAPRNDHYRDFIMAVRERRKAGSDFSYGGPLTELALLGGIAQLFPGQELKWDGPNMRFTNSKEATRLLTPTFRDGWSL